MCTIKRVGRWGDFSPSAFYVLNIINDHSLLFTKVFGRHWCLTAMHRCLRKHRGCSSIENLQLASYQGLVWEVQESSVEDTFPRTSLYFPLSWESTFTGKSISACQFSQKSVLPFLLPSLSPAHTIGASLCPALPSQSMLLVQPLSPPGPGSLPQPGCCSFPILCFKLLCDNSGCVCSGSLRWIKILHEKK